MKKLKLLLILSQSAFINAFGKVVQNPGEIDMADKFRADGKIYVVIAILLIIFLGILIFLIRVDRKISKLEKEVNERKKNIEKE